jgi:hypothetical protein
VVPFAAISLLAAVIFQKCCDMSDAQQPQAPASPSTIRPSAWPRITAVIIAVFTAVLALATLALVVTAIFQHNDAVKAIEANSRVSSAEFVMKLDAMLNDHRFDRISDDIDSHDNNYRLPKYTNRSDANVADYITIFDTIGYFIKEGLIEPKLAYEFFSYDIEKAWCNPTVQETVREERATDKAKTARSDPAYGDFERLANEYLETDGLPCKDLDSGPAKVQKKKKSR